MIWYLARTRFLGPSVVAHLMLSMMLPLAISASRLMETVTWAYVGTLTVLLLILQPRSITPFDAGLPIPSRDFVKARMLGSALRLLAPAALTLAIAPFWNALDAESMGLLLQYVAFVPLAVLLPELLPPVRLGTPNRLHAAVVLAGTAIAYTSMLALLPHAAVMLALAACTLLVGVRVIFATPPAIELAPVAVTAIAKVRASSHPQFAASNSDLWTRMAWWRVIARDTTGWMVVFQWLLSFAMGALGNAMWFLPIGIGSTASAVRTRTLWLRSLPVSRGVQLLLIVLPSVALPFALFGLAQQIVFTRVWSYTMGLGAPMTPHAADRYFSSPTRVPLAFWKVAPEGIAPRLVSPSGEWSTAYTISVAGVLFYNPYSSREASSKTFIDWQFRRASSAVYGREFTQDEYKRASYDRSLPRLRTNRGSILLLSGAALLTYLLFLLWLSSLSPNPPRDRRGLAVSSAWLTQIPHFLIIGIDSAYVTTGSRIVGPLSEMAMLNVAAWLPDNLAVVALVALLPVAAMYALLSWQFARSETLERIVPVRV